MQTNRPPHAADERDPRSAGVVAAVAVLTAALTACAQAQQDTSAMLGDALPPAGYGTLRQESVALRLRTDQVQIQVVPLDERVIRLLAPDTYNSLHRLILSKETDVETAAQRHSVRDPTLFLVTFFGLQPETRFTPEDLTVTSQNRLFRPLEILPLSPLWSGHQISQRETALAIYLYGDGINVLDPFVVEYVVIRNDSWEQVLRVLDGERASVLARATADRTP
jgi:hypothetical protein